MQRSFVKSFIKLPIISLAAALLLQGCATNEMDNSKRLLGWTQLFDQNKLRRTGDWAIDKNVNLYIALPPQQELDDELYAQLVAAFRRYYPNTRSTARRASLPQSLASASYAGMDFLVYPRIEHRQPHTGWQRYDLEGKSYVKFGRLGALDIDLIIFAVNGQQLVDQIQFQATSGLFAEQETDQLWQPLDLYLQRISQY
ncbi:MAG: DUF4823 domain-containing protein [Pseudomonadales bacterium]|nr:DUF4823 domain-containing protein [Pseudomonadales bacterium]